MWKDKSVGEKLWVVSAGTILSVFAAVLVAAFDGVNLQEQSSFIRFLMLIFFYPMILPALLWLQTALKKYITS